MLDRNGTAIATGWLEISHFQGNSRSLAESSGRSSWNYRDAGCLVRIVQEQRAKRNIDDATAAAAAAAAAAVAAVWLGVRACARVRTCDVKGPACVHIQW
ncbi:hypothetical protein K0M31_014903 [Melipona bicolor]|uniref:Uncharacterized protein n=1 Tax=Melipona bicolor TaxID=60889 RepID=A0AA40KFN4_9HYME|nr:hypothetical protein K0M31_014903 [Melipona bicolor]